jgi:hypothetical protein
MSSGPLAAICRAMQVISPECHLEFRASGTGWRASLLVGQVILVDAKGEDLDSVFSALAEKMGVLAERLASAMQTP